MANRTLKEASTVKGTNPQYLIEKVVRSRIYDSRYWKEECFALSAEMIVDKGMELRYIGGVHGGNVRPTPFLCLQLKMLQIQPEKEIVIEFIRQEEFKYIRALGAMYLRLTFSSVEIYQYLEPLLNDYRKLRWMNKQGKFELTYVDEFVDKLLREDYFCDIQLPRLQKRDILEEMGQLTQRTSLIDEELERLSESDSDVEKPDDNTSARSSKKKENSGRSRLKSPSRRHSRRDENRERSRSRDKGERKERPKRKDWERRSTNRDKASSRRSDDRQSKSTKGKRETSEEREIRESNELRAKLGMAPLQP